MNDLSYEIIARDMTQGAFASLGRSLAKAESGAVSASAAFESGFARASREMLSASQAVNGFGDAAQSAGVKVDRSLRMIQARSRNLSFQLVDIGQALATAPTMGIYALQNLGFQVAQIGQLYAGQGGFTQAIKDSAGQVARFATRMGPLAAATALVAAGFAGLTHEINKTSRVQVSFGDVALGVLQTVRDGIYTLLEPAISAIAPWFEVAWAGVVDFTKFGINSVVSLFVGGFNAVKAVWSNLPSAIGEFVIAMANNALAGIESLINGAIDRLKALNSMLPERFQFESITNMGGVNLSKLDNPFAGATSDMVNGVDKAFADANQNWAGSLFNSIRGNAISNALARTKDDATKASSAMSQMARDALGGIKSLADETNAAVEEGFRAIGAAADYVSDRIDGFFDGIASGKSVWPSLRDEALGALSDISRAIIRSNIGQLFGALFGQSAMGPLQSGIPLFAGFRANGGPIPAGSFAVTGEAGPELVTGPANVTPLSRLGGGTTYAPVYQIDARGADAGTEQRLMAMLAAWDRKRAPEIIREATKAAGGRFGLSMPATAT